MIDVKSISTQSSHFFIAIRFTTFLLKFTLTLYWINLNQSAVGTGEFTNSENWRFDWISNSSRWIYLQVHKGQRPKIHIIQNLMYNILWLCRNS
jgi:hypothetical protein